MIYYNMVYNLANILKIPPDAKNHFAPVSFVYSAIRRCPNKYAEEPSPVAIHPEDQHCFL